MNTRKCAHLTLVAIQTDIRVFVSLIPIPLRGSFYFSHHDVMNSRFNIFFGFDSPRFTLGVFDSHLQVGYTKQLHGTTISQSRLQQRSSRN